MLSKIYGILYRQLLGTGISKHKSISKVHNYFDLKIQKNVSIEGIKFLGIIENIVQVYVTNIPEIEFCKNTAKTKLKITILFVDNFNNNYRN